MIIAALLLAVLSVEPQVFREPLREPPRGAAGGEGLGRPGGVHFLFLPRVASRRGRGLRAGPRDRFRGQDKMEQDFEMTALLAGRGKLVILYDHDGIVYRNERLARDFKLASRVEFETPAAGVLENVQGALRQGPAVWLRACSLAGEGRRDARGTG